MENLGGAPLGNKNATKGKRWSDAIDRALAKRSKSDAIIALDDLAEKLLAKCDEGDITALKELGNRLEGMPTQQVIGAGDEGEHLVDVSLQVSFIGINQR